MDTAWDHVTAGVLELRSSSGAPYSPALPALQSLAVTVQLYGCIYSSKSLCQLAVLLPRDRQGRPH